MKKNQETLAGYGKKWEMEAVKQNGANFVCGVYLSSFLTEKGYKQYQYRIYDDAKQRAQIPVAETFT